MNTPRLKAFIDLPKSKKEATFKNVPLLFPCKISIVWKKQRVQVHQIQVTPHKSYSTIIHNLRWPANHKWYRVGQLYYSGEKKFQKPMTNISPSPVCACAIRQYGTTPHFRGGPSADWLLYMLLNSGLRAQTWIRFKYFGEILISVGYFLELYWREELTNGAKEYNAVLFLHSFILKYSYLNIGKFWLFLWRLCFECIFTSLHISPFNLFFPALPFTIYVTSKLQSIRSFKIPPLILYEFW